MGRVMSTVDVFASVSWTHSILTFGNFVGSKELLVYNCKYEMETLWNNLKWIMFVIHELWINNWKLKNSNFFFINWKSNRKLLNQIANNGYQKISDWAVKLLNEQK